MKSGGCCKTYQAERTQDSNSDWAILYIKSGPFTAFTGRVEGINQAKCLLKVMVNIYGPAKPVKLRFVDVEKV